MNRKSGTWLVVFLIVTVFEYPLKAHVNGPLEELVRNGFQ